MAALLFRTDYVRQLALVEKFRRQLFSFTGLVDALVVLFLCLP